MSDLTALPSTISAGTTIGYRRTLSDYPASAGWTLKLYLSGPSNLIVTATAAGDDFDVAITPAQSASLKPGTYTFIERVSKAGASYDPTRSQVVVLADVATAGPGTMQSWEERTLEVVELALSGSLESGIQSYQIHGRAVSRIEAGELLKIRQQLKSAIASRKSGKISRPILIRFTTPGVDR